MPELLSKNGRAKGLNENRYLVPTKPFGEFPQVPQDGSDHENKAPLSFLLAYGKMMGIRKPKKGRVRTASNFAKKPPRGALMRTDVNDVGHFGRLACASDWVPLLFATPRFG
jgi:hypothetical protein